MAGAEASLNIRPLYLFWLQEYLSANCETESQKALFTAAACLRKWNVGIFDIVKGTRPRPEAGNFCVRHLPNPIRLQRVLIFVKFRDECWVFRSVETQTMARSPWQADWWRRVMLHLHHRIKLVLELIIAIIKPRLVIKKTSPPWTLNGKKITFIAIQTFSTSAVIKLAWVLSNVCPNLLIWINAPTTRVSFRQKTLPLL